MAGSVTFWSLLSNETAPRPVWNSASRLSPNCPLSLAGLVWEGPGLPPHRGSGQGPEGVGSSVLVATANVTAGSRHGASVAPPGHPPRTGGASSAFRFLCPLPLRPGGTDRPGRAQALCAPPGPPRSRWPRVRHRPLADRLAPARGAAGPSGAGAPGRLSSRTRRVLRKEARAGGTSAAADSGLTPTSGDGGVQTPWSRRRCPSHPLACRSRRGLPLCPSAALAGPGPGEAGESHSLPWLPAFYVRGRRPLFALCGCHRGVIVGWPWGPRCVTHVLSHVQPGSLSPWPRRGSEVLAPREGAGAFGPPSGAAAAVCSRGSQPEASGQTEQVKVAMNTSSVRTRVSGRIPGPVTFLSPPPAHVRVAALPPQDACLRPLQVPPPHTQAGLRRGRGSHVNAVPGSPVFAGCGAGHCFPVPASNCEHALVWFISYSVLGVF